jgi:hypothetical protein
MKTIAAKLKPGDLFKVLELNAEGEYVHKPDPEGPIRVCISNDGADFCNIKWGWPGFPRTSPFWSYMGYLVPVEILP